MLNTIKTIHTHVYISFRETLANEWTSKAVCESCADWLKFEDLSNRDQQVVRAPFAQVSALRRLFGTIQTLLRAFGFC